MVELACYLALHRERPVSGESLRAALRPDGSKEQSAKTLRTYLSMLRKALGPDALPSRPSGGYQLASWVTTDWERFVELSRSDDVDDALEALSLIRGRPFEGVPSGTYAWVFSEFLVSDMEVAIASVVTRAVDAAGQGRRPRAGPRRGPPGTASGHRRLRALGALPLDRGAGESCCAQPCSQ